MGSSALDAPYMYRHLPLCFEGGASFQGGYWVKLTSLNECSSDSNDFKWMLRVLVTSDEPYMYRHLPICFEGGASFQISFWVKLVSLNECSSDSSDFKWL